MAESLRDAAEDYPDLLVDAGDGLRLAGYRCAGCGLISFPDPATLCPRCGKGEFAPHAFGAEGTVWTYTVVHHRPPGYLGPLPYALGIVAVPEGCRVESILAPLERVRIGAPVRLIALEAPVDEAGRTWRTYAYEVAG